MTTGLIVPGFSVTLRIHSFVSQLYFFMIGEDWYADTSCLMDSNTCICNLFGKFA